jgi:hypothetical protein
MQANLGDFSGLRQRRTFDRTKSSFPLLHSAHPGFKLFTTLLTYPFNSGTFRLFRHSSKPFGQNKKRQIAIVRLLSRKADGHLALHKNDSTAGFIGQLFIYFA